MKDDSGLELNNSWSSDTLPPKPRRAKTDGGSFRRVLLVILLIFIILGGIFYFFSRRPTGIERSLLETRMNALEQRIGSIEKQLADLQSKLQISTPDPAIMQKIDLLAQKIEALEAGGKKPAEPKPRVSTPAKAVASKALPERKYHQVQKGETLYSISRKYGLSVDELRKLNNIPPDKALRVGQKLRVSREPD